MLLIFKSPPTKTFTYPDLPRALNVIFEDPVKSVRIRSMSLSELVETREKWLIPEGWPGMKFTLTATYANDRDGFYLLEKDGQKIASISVVTYPEIKFAYIGFYIVTKPFRNQGYGKLLITKTMQHTTEKLGITAFGLNCVESAVSMYQKYGFTVTTVDEFWKYTAVEHASKPINEIINLNNLDQNLLRDVIDFDASVLGAQRTGFITEFLFKPNTVIVIVQEDDKIQGYGIISEREPAIVEQYKSYRIGPLYANDTDLAQAILKQLITVAEPHESVFLETPGNNIDAVALVKLFGFERTGVQPKMFKGIATNLDIKKVFCYSSIAIGG